MRNYIQAFFGSVDWLDGGMNPGTSYLVDETVANIALGITELSQSLTNNGFTVTGSAQLGPRYYLCDKASVLNMLVNIGAGALWNFPIPAQFQDPGTPRNGYTDVDGNVRRPPPSDKPSRTRQTANVLAPAAFAVLEQLQTLANSLLKSTDAGQRRIGGIILYEVGLAVSGRKTLSAALSFLEPFLAQIK